MTKKQPTLFESAVVRLYQEDKFSTEKYQQVRQSKVFMERFFCDKIELEQLANAAHMSRYHYVRVFQQMYGMTPRLYLRDLRVSKAKLLLKQGKPITQVCLDVGYESLPTFSSIFKKCTGTAPKAYQKKHYRNLE